MVKRKISLIYQITNPNISQLGCFISYTGITSSAFRYINNPIVAKVNLKDEPIIKSKDEIIQKLSNVVDYILDFNREIINTSDDSYTSCR